MALLYVYEDKVEAEAAVQLLRGPKRLASERDDNKVIYNLFGEATWGNFYRLELFDLHELKSLVDKKNNMQEINTKRHESILSTLKYIAKQFDLEIPSHWL
jgi:hypothetical protein